MRSDDRELILPHPRAHQRAFVLVPWLDVEPEAVLTAEGRRLGIGDWLTNSTPPNGKVCTAPT